MGNASWSAANYANYSRATKSKPRSTVFTSRGIHEPFDPSKIKYREAVDSEANPEATPIILATDVTGSMGILAEEIVKTQLGTIMGELYKRVPVTNPQIMCMAIGDVECDSAPLQVTQFEADMRIVEQLEKLWLEAGGGGNGGESYSLAWWFATYKCKTDAWLKRRKRGYIFTIGDECCLPYIAKDKITRFLGVPCEADIPTEALLTEVQKYWHVYHLMVNPVVYQRVEERWKDLLGNNAVHIEDINMMAEGIVSIIQMTEGHDKDEIVASWQDEKVRKVVAPLLLASN